MSIQRKLLNKIKHSPKSVLLLGPRQTGKSTLIGSLKPDLSINLADEEVFVEFLRDPGLLKRRIGNAKTVFIDEVQRLPSLLNTVQTLIDAKAGQKFYLTGSSAQKLKRGKANLLPGRIFVYNLGPLSASELGADFDLNHAMSFGLLPEPALTESPEIAKKLLRSYSTTYLKEEIQAEALTRNLEGFSRFFEVIAEKSGTFLDFTKFSSQAAIERTSAKRYFDILCDTLITEQVTPFTKSQKRRLIQHPRYYFFDVGVLNGVLNNFEASADRKGLLFEHLFLQLVLSEFKASDKDFRVSVYRTEGGSEVDFVFETGKELFAVEVKASKTLGPKDFTGLKSFKDFYGKACTCLVVYTGANVQDYGGILAMPIKEALATICS